MGTENRKNNKNKPKKDEGLVNSMKSFFKDLLTRTTAVAIWDGIKQLGKSLLD